MSTWLTLNEITVDENTGNSVVKSTGDDGRIYFTSLKIPLPIILRLKFFVADTCYGKNSLNCWD